MSCEVSQVTMKMTTQ